MEMTENEALHKTCWGKNLDTMKYFIKLHLKHGADINWVDQYHKRTALDIAWKMHNHKLVEFIQSLGGKTLGEILTEQSSDV